MATTRPRAYQIRAALRGFRSPIWRRLEIPADLSLEELHTTLQVAFGWLNSCLFEFKIDGETYGLTDEESDARELSPESVLFTTKVGDVLHKSARATYAYDMTDYWVLDIEVEREIPAREAKPYAVCTGGEREAPREGSGGVEGFKQEQRSVVRFAKAHDLAPDPDVLDLEFVNSKLAAFDVTSFARGVGIAAWPALP